MGKQTVFTSESVTSGHPDKVCDRISDAILDALLEQDPQSRAAVECMVTTGQVHIAGEIATSGWVDVSSLARQAILDIGYDDPSLGFEGNSCGVLTSIDQQSPNIAGGVNESWEVRTGTAVDEFDRQGAGDQGLMFGYACNETPDLMPAPIWLAHRLAKRLEEVRREGILDYLRPDGKSQVSVRYDGQRPVALDAVVLSTQHRGDVELKRLRAEVEEAVLRPVLAEIEWAHPGADRQLRTLINPAGSFEIGGPAADTGLTGRKIIVDTYGGMARHGGGAFSGKDASKVDRSAAYAARWVAKNIVAAGLAERCEVQVSYAIGSAHPTSLLVDTFGTGKVSDEKLEAAVREAFDLRPAAIVAALDLKRPCYAATSSYGHFGRPEFTWESTQKAQELLKLVD